VGGTYTLPEHRKPYAYDSGSESDSLRLGNTVSWAKKFKKYSHIAWSDPCVQPCMTYPDGAREVEFAGRDGRAFAILPLRPDQLMVLHDTPDFAAA